MRILQINTTINTGSTGRIAEDIGQLLIKKGHQSFIAFGRDENRNSSSSKIKIGSKKDFYSHILLTRIWDKHGFGSLNETKKFLEKISLIQPDIIHLHNIHGYFIHVGILFQFLKELNKPIVWTFHDCWPFTGHCAYFERVNCQKWQTQCQQCPLTHEYPKSLIIDNSFNNFNDKKKAFTGLKDLHIITPSKWLSALVKKSFLKKYPVEVINNGIDLNTFRPIKNHLKSKKPIILGVASTWSESKGLLDFVNLQKRLLDEVEIVLIGLSKQQIKNLPIGIKGIERTESIEELAEWYNKASVFINPTYADNFPTTNIEALACGTPVITYNTGGSPEVIDINTGAVVEKGDIDGLTNAIKRILKKDLNMVAQNCRKRAETYFNKEERFQDYLDLYNSVLNNHIAKQ